MPSAGQSAQNIVSKFESHTSYICGKAFQTGLNVGSQLDNSKENKMTDTQGAKSLYLAKKRLEVTSPAIVVLNAFSDSSDLPKEGLSGLLWKFFWRDALIRRYLDVLFVIYS